MDFWAHADSQSLTIRFAVETASASEDDYFGGDVDLTPAWGSSVISYPLIGAALTRQSDGAIATDVDLAGATHILFDYRPPAGAADFGFWIDDVQLKRK